MSSLYLVNFLIVALPGNETNPISNTLHRQGHVYVPLKPREFSLENLKPRLRNRVRDELPHTCLVLTAKLETEKKIFFNNLNFFPCFKK